MLRNLGKEDGVQHDELKGKISEDMKSMKLLAVECGVQQRENKDQRRK